MAVNAFVTFEGQKQGKLRRSNGKGNHAGKSLVFAWALGLQSPWDCTTGMPSGTRRHQPITIRKEVDLGTPQLFNALIAKEILDAKIEHFKLGKADQRPNYILKLTGG